MAKLIHPADLAFVLALAQANSLSAAAREQGITPAAVSRRLSQMEARLGVALVNRTTRRMSFTPEGEVYLESARHIMAAIDDLEGRLWGQTQAPQGLLRVNATLGFGRSHIAPLISSFCRQYPKVDVQLQLSVNPPAMTDDACDVCFRFGSPPDARIIARFIAANRRLVVAAPDYVTQHGEPQTPQDLVRHNCIGIRQGDEAYGVWRFHPTHSDDGQNAGRGAPQSVKVRGNLTTNDGGIAVRWALDGHGVLLRAQWDVQPYIDSGQLRPLLTAYASPDADIYAVYAERHRSSARVQALVNFVETALRP